MKIRPYIQLMRPANIITAMADIIAGYAIAMSASKEFEMNDLSLILATIGLYGGGIVLNDVFDSKLDAIERPERPIPRGDVSRSQGMLLGILLLFYGIGIAWINDASSGIIAMAIAFFAVFYNKFGKHHLVFGPINMGLCRAGNLLLGMSANVEIISDWAYLALIPLIYIAAVTLVSRGEVNGSNSKALYGASLLYLIVIGAQLFVAYNKGVQLSATTITLSFFVFLVFPPLIKAIKNPVSVNIGKAVRAGVISLIIMDASWCIAFGNISLGLLTIALLPVSLFLSRHYAVT